MRFVTALILAAALLGCSTFELSSHRDSGWEKAGKIAARSVVGVATLGISEIAMDKHKHPRKYQNRGYVPYIPPPVYQRAPVQLYAPPAMVLPAYRPYQPPLPAYRPYQPPRQLYCTPAYDGMGGQICR